jgi:phosphosulfolactate synthase
VLDKGMSMAQVDELVEVAGEHVDLVKLGWGTSLVIGNLEAKLARYAEHGLPVVLGGTLTELAIAQDRVDALVAWIGELGLAHIEISDGTITLAHEDKVALISRLVDEGLTVMSEVGSKDADMIMAPYRWVEQIQAELEAGAWRVIAEARETGTAGIFRSSGEVRGGLIDEIAHAVDPGKMLFEAPQKGQQVWFIERFGAEVNLGNIPPEDVIGLETLRRGLRSDTADLTLDR